MADYMYLTPDGDEGAVLRRSDEACIPAAPENKDRVAFDEWRATNEADPFVPLAAPIPPSISDRQFFQQLAVAGIISQIEALAAVKTGAVPAALQALVDAMPEADRFGAEMIISGGTTFERAHPLTIAIGAAYGMSTADIDDFFVAAAAL